MSASAVKSSLPGASMQAAPQAATHSIMPMNMMAQKVVTTSNAGPESGPIKPLSNSNLSYVTLQPPANQPLSLVQEHKLPTQPVRLSEKPELETDKVMPNGMEIPKSTPSDDAESPQKKHKPEQSETSQQNNNVSSETSVPTAASPDHVAEPAFTSAADVPEDRSVVQSKIEERKPSLSNGAKEHEQISTSNVPVRAKTPIEDAQKNQRANSIASTPNSVASTPSSASSTLNSCASTPNSTVSTPSSKTPADTPAVTHSTKTESQVETPRRSQKRKSREVKDLHGSTSGSDSHGKPKRNRVRTQPYQSPLPELALIVKTLNKSPSSRAADDKLIVFYKNEFLAVRNAEGSFYVCQAMQNIYKSSRRIRIRWLSQDKNNGEIYSPDFYDFTDFDCILTNLNLNKIDKNKYQLTKMELLRTENILKRAIDVEAGLSEKPRVTEEHPDGLDLSLFRDESQLKPTKKGNKQKRTKSSTKAESTDTEDNPEDESDSKVSPAKQPLRKIKSAGNKLTPVAKTIVKGGNDRAERAATRSSRTAYTSVSDTDHPIKKRSADNKKSETKKVAAKQESDNFNTLPRKSKASTAAETNAGTNSTLNAFGRPKRTATSLGIPSVSTSEPAVRKKPRSRA